MGRRERPPRRSRRPDRRVGLPPRRVAPATAPASYRLPACTTATGGRSIATVVGADGGRRAPIGRGERAGSGARSLRRLRRDVEGVGRRTEEPSARNAAISYAAYRVLLWDASFNSNLGRTFALLTRQAARRSATRRTSAPRSERSPAALGNRIAAAAIAAGRHDGSNESLHFADPTLRLGEPAPDRPCRRLHRGGRDVLAAAGARDDPAAQQPGRGAGRRPELCRRASGATSAASPSRSHAAAFRSTPARRRCGIPRARRTSRLRSPSCGRPPPARRCRGRGRRWRGTRSPRGKRAGISPKDVRLYLGVDAALNDAAVATWGAKRA